jgi:osmotically-inducible protein OsmY
MTSERAGRRGLLVAAALTFALAVGAVSSPNRMAASDLWTTLEVRLGLVRAVGAAALDIGVGTADGAVTLRGFAASDEEKAKADSIARGVGGMRPVRNLIHVTRRFAALEHARAGVE